MYHTQVYMIWLAHTYIHTYIHSRDWGCIVSVAMFCVVYIYTCMYISVYIYIYIYIYTCIYIYTHTCIHSTIRTCMHNHCNVLYSLHTYIHSLTRPYIHGTDRVAAMGFLWHTWHGNKRACNNCAHKHESHFPGSSSPASFQLQLHEFNHLELAKVGMHFNYSSTNSITLNWLR